MTVDEKSSGYWDGYKRNLAAVIRGHKMRCPDHLGEPSSSCMTCERNSAFERAAQLAEEKYTVVTPPPGTVIEVKPPIDTAAAAHTGSAIHQCIYGETLYRDGDERLQKVSWSIDPGGYVVAGEGWEPVVDDDKMLTGFRVIVEGLRCSQCGKPGRLCRCTGGPWPDFARPLAQAGGDGKMLQFDLGSLKPEGP